MKLIDITGLPTDKYVLLKKDKDSCYLATVQRTDFFIHLLKSLSDRVSFLDSKIISGGISSQEDQELERLDKILFEAELEEKFGRFFLTGLIDQDIPEYDELKLSLQPKNLLRLKRYGILDTYQVNANDEVTIVSRDDYIDRFFSFAQHINDVISEMAKIDYEIALDNNIGSVLSLNMSRRLQDYVQSFYEIHYSFPGAFLTFFDIEGKPILVDTGKYPDFERRFIPCLENSDVCIEAEKEFLEYLK
ncbi:MAG: hypothetical protein ACMXYG_00945 [Candidatus Woesearchaeota archaeon]